jgi:hypothetical protein
MPEAEVLPVGVVHVVLGDDADDGGDRGGYADDGEEDAHG